jgi:hypothetical protein
MKDKILLCFAFCFVLFMGCSSGGEHDEHDHSGHGHEYHMKPRKSDDLKTLMHKSTVNVSALVDGLISNNKKKLFIGTANLSSIADLALQLPFLKNEDQLDNYTKLYMKQRNILASIRKLFLKKEQEEAIRALPDLFSNCLSCHNQFLP